MSEQTRDVFEALLDDSLGELRVNGHTHLRPPRLLVIFLTTLTSQELDVFKVYSNRVAVDSTDSVQESITTTTGQYTTDVLEQTQKVHALLSERHWSHRFLQRIRHTVLLLQM